MTRCCHFTARKPASTSPASIIGWYTKGLPGSAEFRNRVNAVDDPSRVTAMLRDFYDPFLQRAAA